MKHIVLLLFLFFTIDGYAQRIVVKGIAFDTTRGRNWVTVILNDTMRKTLSRKPVKWDEDTPIWRDSNYVVHARANGRFQISAKKTDSLFFESNRHIRKSYLVADLLKMSEINILLEPEVCEVYVECQDTMPEHFVFIGEKIKVDYEQEKYYCNMIFMDSRFAAEYRIVENVYGKFPKDTIDFVAYDHYGKPGFEKFKYVMLFVSRYCDRLLHQKYQFFDVYKTADGRWAAPYPVYDYARLGGSSTIKPELIRFKENVEFDVSNVAKERIAELYPSPYYTVKNGKAIAVYGNYVPELLEIKKQTVLKARKIDLK